MLQPLYLLTHKHGLVKHLRVMRVSNGHRAVVVRTGGGGSGYRDGVGGSGYVIISLHRDKYTLRVHVHDVQYRRYTLTT